MTIADKGVLTIEHIECLVLDMVEMVRRGMSRRCHREKLRLLILLWP